MIGHRSAELLKCAIESLVRFCPQTHPWELVLIVNGGHSGVNDFAHALLADGRFPLAVVRIQERKPGAARNAGVLAARAPVLFFLDDDIQCYQDVIGAAIEVFRDGGVQAAGGANLTPPRSGALARATGSVMGTWVGAASMRKRYRVTQEGPAGEHGLILCNLAVRKSVFESERGFAAHLISNEENVLLQRLAARDATLWSSPKLAVFHSRRDTWRGLCSQAAKYGGGRAQNLLLVPESFHPMYFLPLALLLYVATLPLLLFSGGILAAVPLALYLGIALGCSAGFLWSKRDPAQLLGVLVFPCVHLAYGWGFLRALVGWAPRRKLLEEHVI